MSFLGDIADAVGIGETGIPWSAAASAAGSLLGFAGQQDVNATNMQIASGNNEFNAQQAQLNRDFQAQQAQTQRDYQQWMSNTAYSRAVQGLKDAGLNPMLAYQQGGASTPPGAMPGGSQASSAGLPQIGNRFAAGAATAGQITSALQGQADLDRIQAQTAKERAAATRDIASAGQLDAQAAKTRREIYELVNSWEDLTTGGGRRASLYYKSFQDKYQAGILSSEDLNAANYYSERARELKNKAEILGLEVPQALAEASYWRTDFARNKMFIDAGMDTAGKFIGSAVGLRRTAGGAKGITINQQNRPTVLGN